MITAENFQREAARAMAGERERDERIQMGRLSPVRVWPNDCAECGARMEFAFEPQPHRACPACHHTVTAAQCLRPS